MFKNIKSNKCKNNVSEKCFNNKTKFWGNLDYIYYENSLKLLSKVVNHNKIKRAQKQRNNLLQMFPRIFKCSLITFSVPANLNFELVTGVVIGIVRKQSAHHTYRAGDSSPSVHTYREAIIFQPKLLCAENSSG